MKEYKVYDFDGEIRGIVQAKSFEQAFNKVIGDYVHKEVTLHDTYDVSIKCGNKVKYIWIRWG